MNVVYSLDELSKLQEKNLVITIGMFDGVHRGHQKVLLEAKRIAHEKGAKLMAITFSNHPKEVLNPSIEIRLLTPMQHKLSLLESYGVDIAVVLKFTQELAQKTAFQFLSNINGCVSFTDFILGYDATLGSDQENNRQNVLSAAEALHANVHYISEEVVEGAPVSSRRIRQALERGNNAEAEKLLGHRP